MNFIFTNKPSSHWNELCRNHGDLFNTHEWHEVLAKGFGSETLYGWDEAISTGVTITIFKAGPFRIGYLGFPVGGTVGGDALASDIIASLKKNHFPGRLHCIHIPASAFVLSVNLDLPAVTTPETAIENLQEWHPETDRKLRQDLNRARRSPVQIVDASDSLYGSSLFSLYRKTVSRNRGNMRYTEAYFSTLIDIARTHEKMRCLLALMDSEVIGFEIAACHGKTAYSLHGFTDPDFKLYSASDLLTCEAINWAKQQGAERYNLMASPADRLSLVKYKEKWGGITRQQKTYELVLKPLHTGIFKVTAALYQEASRFVGFR